MSVVIPILLCALTVVQVNQHVGQALMQSVLHMISGCLCTLAILRLLVVVVACIVVRVLIVLVLSLILGVLVAGRSTMVLVLLVAIVGPAIATVRLWILTCIVVLIGTFLWLLKVRVLSGLGRLSRVWALITARLTVLGTIIGVLRVVLGPLVRSCLVFNLIAQLVFLAFFVVVHALFVSVFLLAFLFAFFIVGLGTHVFRGRLHGLAMSHARRLRSTVLHLRVLSGSCSGCLSPLLGLSLGLRLLFLVD